MGQPITNCGERRIYVVIASTIETTKGRITQPAGRQIAQACHATGIYRYHKGLQGAGYEPITTIILQARDSSEMKHVSDLLLKRKIQRFSFQDTNPDYGPGEFVTAFCTEPIYKDQVIGLIDYLPLWNGGSK